MNSNEVTFVEELYKRHDKQEGPKGPRSLTEKKVKRHNGAI